jgi:DNA-binding HxlR family transcriptional regulator
MNGHGQFCPVAVACEVFAHRWTPLILRELFAGSTHFNEIRRGLPLISKSLLAQRLRALEAAGVVTCVNATDRSYPEYRLTPAGAEFKPVLESLGAWGQRWTIRFDPQNLDAELLMWNDGLPPKYRRSRIFWLITEPVAVDLCLKDPGAEVDLYVSADLGSFARIWLGDMPFAEAVRDGKIRLTGRRDLARRFPSWLLLSHFADVPRPIKTSL